MMSEYDFIAMKTEIIIKYLTNFYVKAKMANK